MAHSLTKSNGHLEGTTHTQLVVGIELVLIERKQSGRFERNSILCQKYIRAGVLIGWPHCAKVKVKGHTELKVEKRE